MIVISNLEFSYGQVPVLKNISMKLEENERGATTRLMKVKDMMAKRDA